MEKLVLFYSSSAEPVLGVIFFPEVADYDSLAGAGMYKLAVLEVDAYVCHFFAGSTAGEEHQISLTRREILLLSFSCPSVLLDRRVW